MSASADRDMKTILVVGDRESGKDDLIEFVLKRGKKLLPDFGYIKFDDYLTRGVYHTYDKSLKDIKKLQSGFQRRVIKDFEELKKIHQNIIINGHFFVEMKHGFVSLMNSDLYNVFKPDALIIIELYPQRVDPRFRMFKKQNPFDIRSLKLQQDIIRKFATMYTSSGDTILKVVQVEKDKVNQAFNEVMDTVKFILSERRKK